MYTMRTFLALTAFTASLVAGRPGNRSETNNGAIILGGWESGVESYGCTGEVPQLATTLRSTAATWYQDKVHVCGGWNIDDSFFKDCMTLEDGQWIQQPEKIKIARNDHTLNTLGDKMIITGGLGEARWLDTVEIFDGESWQISQHTLTIDRASHCAVAISDTELVTLGGQRSNGQIILETLGTMEMFELEKGWTKLGVMFPPRYGHACSLLGNEVVVSGGSAGDQRVEALDLETLEWRRLPNTAEKRWDHTMETIDGKLHIFGGFWSPNTMEWFDGESWHVEDLTYEHQDSATVAVPCA